MVCCGPPAAELARLPSVLPSYLKALLPKSGLKPGATLPRIAATLHGASFDSAQLAAYRRLCELPPSDTVPPLFPHSFLGPIHLQLMTHASFPFGLLGAVHLRNHIIQQRPLSDSGCFDVHLSIFQGRRRPQGFEFDLTTELSVEGATTWSSCSTFLVREKFAEHDAETALARTIANIDGERCDVGSFAVPADTGKAFGWLCRDINPIHTSFVLAKFAFGFERDLAHGMWALARALPLFAEVDHAKPVRVDCAFKGPVYLERDVRVRAADAAAPGASFELFSGANPRPSIVGRVSNAVGEAVV